MVPAAAFALKVTALPLQALAADEAALAVGNGFMPTATLLVAVQPLVSVTLTV